MPCQINFMVFRNAGKDRFTKFRFCQGRHGWCIQIFILNPSVITILSNHLSPLITGAVISTVTILGYSAMAGTIGGGGLGQIAITYGYQKYDDQIVWLCVALTIIIVQILQEFGMYIARRTDRRART